jgi:tripartite-type tricarboxylate transporter receptor subunit TctC
MNVRIAAVALGFLAASCWAQTYPAKPIRLIHSFQPGGSTDLLARTVGQWVQDALVHTIVI